MTSRVRFLCLTSNRFRWTDSTALRKTLVQILKFFNASCFRSYPRLYFSSWQNLRRVIALLSKVILFFHFAFYDSYVIQVVTFINNNCSLTRLRYKLKMVWARASWTPAPIYIIKTNLRSVEKLVFQVPSLGLGFIATSSLYPCIAKSNTVEVDEANVLPVRHEPRPFGVKVAQLKLTQLVTVGKE